MRFCPPVIEPADRKAAEVHMRRAVELAEGGRFAAAPNPCVGAVLVRPTASGGEVVAEGFHRAAGQPHAEVEALMDARAKGVDPSRCELYVTLEPCNHHGRTPPCTKAILEAGVKKVVVGCLDPNPDVGGGGAAFLRERGVEVATGVLEQECLDLIADFTTWKTQTRPYVLLKLAATLDGRIATRTGHSQWVSGPASRQDVHRLRSRVGAVLVGGNTLYEDDPSLTCRLEGFSGPQPLAVTATRRLPLPGRELQCVSTRPGDTIMITDESLVGSDAALALMDKGVTVWGAPLTEDSGNLDLHPALKQLFTERGVRYVLCEGGGTLGLSMLRAGLADELLLYLAPKILGDDLARPLFRGNAPETMDEAFSMRLVDLCRLDEDLRLTYRTALCSQD